MGIPQTQKAPATLVYYTANRENERVEQKVKDQILKVCPYPIVSVSQAPIDFGENICVGWQQQSYANALRQLEIGILVAKSEFILVAESDCLYPPDYFKFIPPIKNEAYFYNPIWILQEWIGKKYGTGFRKKTLCEGAMIGHRDYLLYRIKRARRFIEDEWVDQETSKRLLQPMFWKHAYKPYWWSGDPVVSIKTEWGVTKAIKDEKVNNVPELPYWGSAKDLRKELFEIST